MNENTLCLMARRRRAHDAERVAEKKTSAPAASRKSRTLPANLLTAATMVGAVLATAALVAGCASTAGVTPSSHALMQPAQAGASASDTAWPQTDWWSAWGDPQLNGLVDKALANAPSLQTVQARLVQAQAAGDVAG